MAKKESVCKNCEKSFEYDDRKSLGIYCSNKCQGEYMQAKNIEDWLSGKHTPSINPMRSYLKQLRGHACEVCGLGMWNDKPIPLEVEHKNGNSDDNCPENVILICPNCHAQTDTYKAKNKGNGRYKRRKRYSDGLSY